MECKYCSRVQQFLLCLVLLFWTVAYGQPAKNPLRIIFMDPDPSQPKNSLPAFRIVTDANRLKTYHEWLNNDAAQWAFDLYDRAWNIEFKDTEAATNPTYYIAIVPDGNHAKVGFQLSSQSNKQTLPDSTYIELDPDEWVFKTTLLHETGHMILAILNGGKEIPKREIAPIPHSTAALTDRGTAFDEGFAIHLETCAAHFLKDATIQDRYDHRKFMFGVPSMLGEYHRMAGSLLSYSQTPTRYVEVRENTFAFAPAFKGPDYFRVQLEKTRDFSELRNPDQLLQSEGFYATFFFSYLVRGDSASLETIAERQSKMLETLAGVLRSSKRGADSPFLLSFVEESIKRYPEDAKEVLDMVLDLSHGVFVDKDAAKLWHDHYIAALQFNMAEAKNETIEAARNRWRTEALNNPGILYSRLGPQLRIEVPEISILLVSFEESAPLSFDANTVEEGIIRMVPEISDAEVKTWLDRRNEKPFSSFDDFKERCPLSGKASRHLKY
jgi:predicted nucleic acid-binding OB-fold protein